MEKLLEELADRGQAKNLLNVKESSKLMISHDIECSLIRFKDVGSEIEQVKKKLAALYEQVEETRKKMDDMMAEQKTIFKTSKEMKMELVALQTECAEYEANAKVAMEEEKTVEAELKGMKDFISSIKGKIQ